MPLPDCLARFRALRVTGVILLSLALTTPAPAGFFDFLFGGDDSGRSEPAKRQNQKQDSVFPNLFEPERPAAPQPQSSADSSSPRSNFTHCVRMCDGKHFPLLNRGGNSPVAMCQAFCPASEAKVFFGSNIDRAISMDGERYSETKNAYAYRKALSPDCTCNGRDPAGLAPIDLSMDSTLRAGDIIATGTGLVAYSGPRGGRGGDFTPIASYTGLTMEARARLGEMKVAPVNAGVDEEYTMSIDAARAMQSDTPRPALD